MTSIRDQWFDAQGKPCAAADAVTGEIAELDDDGVEVKRTYVDLTGAAPATTNRNFDLQVADQDMLKYGTWDIRTVVDGIWTVTTSLSDLLVALDLQDVDVGEQRRRVGEFLALPAWHPAPESLKAETYAWLEATRPNA